MPLMTGPEILVFHSDHSFERYENNKVAASGTYRIEKEGTPPQSVLFTSASDSYGSYIRFDGDTLVLAYAGPYPMLSLPPVSKYVRN